MKKYLIVFILLIAILDFSPATARQNQFTLMGQFTELPSNSEIYLYLYGFNGYSKVMIDSVRLNREGGFMLRLKERPKTGMYEVSLNKSLFVPVIIKEDEKLLLLHASYLQWQTGYIQPGESNENEALKLLRELVAHRNRVLSEIDETINRIDITEPRYRAITDSIRSIKDEVYQVYNEQLTRLERAYASTYVAKVIFPFYFEPVLADFDSAQYIFDNNRAFLSRHFFHYLNLSNPAIIETPLFESKITEYLEHFTHRTENGFEQALNKMLELSAESEEVQKSIIRIFGDYLKKNGFSKLYNSIKNKNQETLVFLELNQCE